MVTIARLDKVMTRNRGTNSAEDSNSSHFNSICLSSLCWDILPRESQKSTQSNVAGFIPKLDFCGGKQLIPIWTVEKLVASRCFTDI